jgi:endonuclease/exonuclease/phosphatase family metal-dependent hydrolase
VAAGGYWLSERPHVPGSKSWGSACVRLATWARLVERATGLEFRFVNTHLDHVGQQARENQARLIAEDASAYPADYPQVLTGDMNCDARNPAIAAFRAGGWRDTYGAVHGTEDPGPTYHGFAGPRHDDGTGKMDWVLVKGGFRALAAEVVRDSRDGRFPSDHYFVGATLAGGGALPDRARD